MKYQEGLGAGSQYVCEGYVVTVNKFSVPASDLHIFYGWPVAGRQPWNLIIAATYIEAI